MHRDDQPCARSNIDAKQAHTYAGDTYSFYKSKHDRDSLDNAGMPLISTVDYCPKPAECPMRNAFWNSERQQMIYGDRIMADDVVGHELTTASPTTSPNSSTTIRAGRSTSRSPTSGASSST